MANADAFRFSLHPRNIMALLKKNPFLKINPEANKMVKELELRVVTNQYLATVLTTAYFAGETITGSDSEKKEQLKQVVSLAIENLEGSPKAESIISFRYLPGNDAPVAFIGNVELVSKFPIVADVLTTYLDKADEYKNKK